MEYVPGKKLTEFIKPDKPMTEKQDSHSHAVGLSLWTWSLRGLRTGGPVCPVERFETAGFC